jgi:APA family basic amino acid/polyamine antiporter
VRLLSGAFVFSALGAMNGSILTGARVPYAMARDGLFFKSLGSVNGATRVPVVAVLAQGAWACVLALSGTFDQLTDYVVFASWIFYALCTASLFVFRRRLPLAQRPYLAPGYPWVPALFLACSLLLLANTLASSPRESLIGLGFIAAGAPAYLLFRRRREPA